MIEVRIMCNDCGVVSEPAKGFKAHILRASLKKKGWRTGVAGKKDYCPRCIEIGEMKRRAGCCDTAGCMCNECRKPMEEAHG